jgi:hypothetical protein
MKNKLLALLCALSLVGCGDCVQEVEGVILDELTHQPIEGVNITKVVGNDAKTNRIEHSDSVGRFEFHSISGGLLGCPDIELQFIKKGYIPLRIISKSFSINDTVYLSLPENNGVPSTYK